MATVAASCAVWPPYRVAADGLTLTTAAGSSVMVAEEDATASAWLVAVIVTVCAAVMVAGAVYRPEELMEPAPAGLIDHVTAVLEALATVAASCAVWPPYRVAADGLTLTTAAGSSVVMPQPAREATNSVNGAVKIPARRFFEYGKRMILLLSSSYCGFTCTFRQPTYRT